MKTETSVVIRALNESKNIAKCLDAVLQQSLKADEILVIDNGSSDGTQDIVKSYGSMNVKLLSCDTIGYSPGLNLGAEMAIGGNIVYLSADCFPDHNWLLNLVSTQKKTGAAVVQGNEVIPPSNPVHIQLAKESSNHDDLQIKFFNNTNTLYDASILKSYIPFFEPKRLGGEDTIMSLRYLRDGHIAYFSSGAKVLHNKYQDIREFESHMYNHGRLSRWFLLNYPLRPRLYLNSFYWSIRELCSGITKRDTNSARIGVSRFFYSLLGFLGIPLIRTRS